MQRVVKIRKSVFRYGDAGDSALSNDSAKAFAESVLISKFCRKGKKVRYYKQILTDRYLNFNT